MAKLFKDKIKEDKGAFFVAATESNHLLSEKEKEILSQLFVEDLSREQCMDLHNLSETKFMEIYLIAVNKLNRGINILNENLREFKLLETGYFLVRKNIGGLVEKMDELKELVNNTDNKEVAKVISTLEIQKLLSEKIYNLPISQRTKNVARAHDLDTFEELLSVGKRSLLEYRNFGKGSIAEIESLLSEYGVKWTNTSLEY